jgi:NAD(P)-dependent dehydrogenase (short-subunit alcohol dehydrogenase family)
MREPYETPIADMSGRVVLVTGATAGLGYATAAGLGRSGATVLVHGRTGEKAEQAVRVLGNAPEVEATRYVAVHADLSSLDEVRRLVSQVHELAPDGLDVLVNNAGAQFSERRLTSDGIEMTTAVVHLATAALSQLLLDHLRVAARRAQVPAQVVNVTSMNERIGKPVTDWGYHSGYGQIRAYSNAKLMALAYTYAMARRVDDSEVTFNAADPGTVFTDFGRKAGGSAAVLDRVFRPVAPLLIAGPEKAARRSVLRALAPDVVGRSGGFYAKGAARTSSKRSRSTATIGQVEALTDERLAASEIVTDAR